MKKVISLVLFIFLACLPNTTKSWPAYTAIETIDSLNYIIDDSGALDSVYAKLHRIYSGSGETITIYHFGDSHINAGFFPERFADSLQMKFGNAGKVILHTPEHRKSRGGRYAFRSKRRHSAKSAGLKNSPAYKLHPQAGIGAGVPMNLATLDSISKLPFQKGIRYISYGVTGKDFPYFLTSELLFRHISEIEPDLVIISLGTNDGFGKNFRPDVLEDIVDRIIKKIKTSDPHAAIMLTTPAEGYVRKRIPNKNIPVVGEILRSRCKTNQCAYWDFYSIMGGHFSMKKWYKAGLAGKDLIHFSKAGYYLQGELLFSAFMHGCNSSLPYGKWDANQK